MSKLSIEGYELTRGCRTELKRYEARWAALRQKTVQLQKKRKAYDK